MTQRQLEIVTVAAKILTGLGVNGLTTKNLAEEMGFSESAIYRHFKSKEEIIIALIEHLTQENDNLLTEVVSSEQPVEEKFASFFQNQINYFNKEQHFIIIVFSDNLMGQSQNINKSILKMMNTMTKHLMAIILEGKQKGVFTNSVTAENLAHIVMGALRLQMFKWQADNFQFNISQRSNNMIDSLLAIIKK